MHGLRGNEARGKTALMANPLSRSTCGFTTLDSRSGYAHGQIGNTRGDSAPVCGLEEPGLPDRSQPLLSSCGTNSVVASHILQKVYEPFLNFHRCWYRHVRVDNCWHCIKYQVWGPGSHCWASKGPVNPYQVHQMPAAMATTTTAVASTGNMGVSLGYVEIPTQHLACPV